MVLDRSLWFWIMVLDHTLAQFSCISWPVSFGMRFSLSRCVTMSKSHIVAQLLFSTSVTKLARHACIKVETHDQVHPRQGFAQLSFRRKFDILLWAASWWSDHQSHARVTRKPNLTRSLESSAYATLAEALRSHISSPRGPANFYEILNVPRGADEQLIIQAHVTQIVSIPFVAEVYSVLFPTGSRLKRFTIK